MKTVNYLLTEYRVMYTPAGYYVGKYYWDTELEYWGAFDRYSGYFATEEEASNMLYMYWIGDADADEMEAVNTYLKCRAAGKNIHYTIAAMLIDVALSEMANDEVHELDLEDGPGPLCRAL